MSPIRPEVYRASIRLLAIFAVELAKLANQAMIEGQPAEHPAVGRARRIIAERCTERLTLKDVARASGLSVCCFCKVFRDTCRLRFSEYVARVRIERVKQLLANPGCRIGEAAFAAGFQSLSQFNRVFRSVLGISPGRFRRGLHAPLAAGARKPGAPIRAVPARGDLALSL